jgi:hypothetical protein
MGWLNPQLVPEGLDLDSAIFYGARWIAPNDIVWDRHAVAERDDKREEREAFIEWLNGGVLRSAAEKSYELHGMGVLSGDKSRIVTLYEDDYGFVIASDFSSYGYTYAGAFRKQDLPDFSVKPVPSKRRYVDITEVGPGMLLWDRMPGVELPRDGMLVVDIKWRDEIFGTITDSTGEDRQVIAPFHVEVLA